MRSLFLAAAAAALLGLPLAAQVNPATTSPATPAAVTNPAPANSKANPKKAAKPDKNAPAVSSTIPMAATLPPPAAPDPKSVVVEQIVARVNDKIITTTDLENAEAELQESAKDTSQGSPMTPAQVAEQQKDMLRTLIDNQLLLQRASDLGMSAETETVLQLDQLRQQNHLATMEDLQKAVESEGQSYEDFQQSIKNQILEKKVIEEDIAPRLQITPEEIAKYYADNKSHFISTDDIQLSEILISTKGKTPEETARLKQLATEIQQRAAKGEDFAKMAQRYSNSDSAQAGGSLPFEKKSDIDPALGKVLFDLPVGGVPPVQTVDGGFLVLKVGGVHHAGQQTLEEAKPEIQYLIYNQKMQPQMHDYLAKLRSDAYITVRQGYTDTGADASAAVNIERFVRVLPTDMPKPIDKDKKSGMTSSVNGGGGN